MVHHCFNKSILISYIYAQISHVISPVQDWLILISNMRATWQLWHPPLFDECNMIWWLVQIMNLLIMKFSPTRFWPCVRTSHTSMAELVMVVFLPLKVCSFVNQYFQKGYKAAHRNAILSFNFLPSFPLTHINKTTLQLSFLKMS
jgi:hypothetical protein